MRLWNLDLDDKNALEKDMRCLARAALSRDKELRIILLNILNKCVCYPESQYVQEAKSNLIRYCTVFENVRAGLQEIADIGFEELALVVPLIREILSRQADDLPLFRARL